MKKAVLLLSLLTSFFCCHAQNTDQIIKGLIEGSFEEIWSDLDTSKLTVYHTKDFILLEDGMVWNNDTIANYQVKALETRNSIQRHNRFEYIKIDRSKDKIWVAYHNYAHWTNEDQIIGKAEWLESAVAVKTKKGWKLELLHSTRIRK